MIESIGDFLSIMTAAVFSVIGFWLLFRVSAKHHEQNLKKMEAKYYRYYQDADDDESDDGNQTYFE